jgi:hypothetical protein
MSGVEKRRSRTCPEKRRSKERAHPCKNRKDGPPALDGVAFPCGWANGLLHASGGAVAQCPNNNCNRITGFQGNQFIGETWRSTGAIGMDCSGPSSNPILSCGVASYPQGWSLGPVGQIDDLVEMDIFHTGKPIFSSANDMVSAGTIYSAIGVGTVVAAPVAVEAVGPGGQVFGRGSWLSRGQYVRIGWSRFGGNHVFRVAGKVVDWLAGESGAKWDIFKGGPL